MNLCRKGDRFLRSSVWGVAMIAGFGITSVLTASVVLPATADAEGPAKGSFTFTGALSGTLAVTTPVCSRQLVPDIPGAFINFTWPSSHLGGKKGGQGWHIAVNVNRSGVIELSKASFAEGIWVTVVGAKSTSDWLATSGSIDLAKGYVVGSVKVTLAPAILSANRAPTVIHTASSAALNGSWTCP